MAKKRPATQPLTRTFIFVPERKMSETILDFAAPLLEPLGPVPALADARGAIELAINVWNLHVMATSLWGKPQFLAEARQVACRPGSPPGLAAVFEALGERRRTSFLNDYRCVGEWSLGPDGAGGHSLRCDARLPEGCEPHVPPRAETRISIDGRYLDEIRLQQTATSFVAFPPERHRADVTGDRIVLHLPALAVVQLFADGGLPTIGGRSVELVVRARPPRRMVLVDVCAGARSAVGEVVSLTFKPADRG
ncbi:MAG: hypothetical protein IPJ34_26045 [Myxococcales bacterium]|nr:hypothetical protein [Myxococcales bacterium]